jgi:hypothetical protein
VRPDIRHLFALDHAIAPADQRALVDLARKDGVGLGTAQLRLALASPDPDAIPEVGRRWLAEHRAQGHSLQRWGFFARLDRTMPWRWREGPATEIVRRVLAPVLPLFEKLTRVSVNVQRPGKAIKPRRDLVPGASYALVTADRWRAGQVVQRYTGEPWLGRVRPIDSASHADNQYLCLRIPISENPDDPGLPFVVVGGARYYYASRGRLYFVDETLPHGADPVAVWRGVVVASGILDPAALADVVRRPVEVRRATTPAADAARAAIERAMQAVSAASARTPRAILAELRGVDLRAIPEAEATERVLALLAREAPDRGWRDVSRLELPERHAYERDIRAAATRREAHIRRTWLSGPHWLCHAVLYMLYLYNRDYGATRASLTRLFAMDQPHPYPRALLGYLLRDLLGVGRDELIRLEQRLNDPAAWAPYLCELFARDRIDGWLRGLVRPVKFYSTNTNTVIGKYDWITRSQKSGMTEPPEADVYYDLGGGHATPDISRLLGRPFVCVDLTSPFLPADTDLIIRRSQWPSELGDGVVPMTEAEQAAYVAELARTPWQRFDVFTDRFDPSFDRYLITSFGFVTSTPRDYSAAVPRSVRGSQLEPLTISYYAVLRVIQLVQLGKTVDLFTYQRATSRRPALLTCRLRFANGRLTAMWATGTNVPSTKPHARFDAELRAGIADLLDPECSTYATLG